MNVDQTMAVVSAAVALVAGIIMFIRRNWVNHGSLK